MAAILTTLAFFPQAAKTIRTGDTNGLSLAMYVLMVSGVAMWLAYGFILWDWPLIISNIIVLVPQTAILLILIRQGAR
jgi:MtN3 and saliva related transmembrane protein